MVLSYYELLLVFSYYKWFMSMLKTVLLPNIFMESMTLFSGFFDK